ncbi:tyrosine-type recombinase/integrase [Pseudoduganella sp. RAF53_2]|uniref:tyrosine-type recombinase/integrase n=1 Tax=unclassified Pseudoduganella TaxID=2637179 RepID=UPI003F951DA4
MSNKVAQFAGRSPLAPLMEQFIQEKRACGYKYHHGAIFLSRFDAFLCSQGLDRCELPRAHYQQWFAKQRHESAANQQMRISMVRQFALYMCRHGHSADVPDRMCGVKSGQASSFAPRIFSHAEIERLLATVDQLKPDAKASPWRHLVMPEVFRLLYGCGLRVNEVLQLRVADVDLVRGVLTVRAAKFGKDRLVPPALPLVQRLGQYAAVIGPRQDDAYFFPSAQGESWSIQGVYGLFRKLLYRSAISHGGRGRGPRIHDLRHTFAVHTLLRWYREGADLQAKLPVLATYLGHLSVEGTQQYLHLTAELFPEVMVRVNETFGDVIPDRRGS